MKIFMRVLRLGRIVMPVDLNLQKEGMIYQREQYRKGGIGRWYWDYRDRAILKLVGDKKIIADIGCGEGMLLEKMIRKFPAAKVFGIDPSPENRRICKERGLEVYNGSVYNLELDDASVDCILFVEVVEHLKDEGLAMKEIRRVLKKDGALVLLFPHDSIFKLTRILTFKFREAFYDAGHVKQWTPEAMEKLLDSSGFEIIFKKNLPFYLWMTSLHCLLVAKKL